MENAQNKSPPQHTPGPWLPNTQLNTIGTRNRKGMLEHVCGAVHDHADLRLIAARPELLEALELLIDFAECS